MQGTNIEEVTEFKYLGILFDKTLTWRKHINTIAAKARRRLNLLKVLTNRKFGADAKIMRTIYIATIKPILEYGAPVIISAAPSNLLILERIQREAIRIMLGAHRTTPSVCLHWEANLDTITVSLEKRTLNYYARTTSIKDHPTAQVLNVPIHAGKLEGHSRTKGNFANRTKDLLIKWQLPTDPIATRIDLRKPEWEMNNINICQKTLCMEKKYECIPTLRATILEHIQTHQGEIIYSDGSKSSDGTGAAFVHVNNGDKVVKGFKIQGIKSSFHAESVGIAKALQYIYDKNFRETTIFTDNKAAIMTLHTKDHNCNIIRD